MNRILLAVSCLLLSFSTVRSDDPLATETIASLTDGKLISPKGTSLDKPDPAAPPIKYYAIYYSAQWCPPCHHFTPELVNFYNDFKPTHPNFELIFVSEDHDEDAMRAYIKEMSMPWPAVRYQALHHDGNGTFKGSGIEKFAGDGIPDLVLVDANGKVLSDSYQNGQYVGPETVIEDIKKIVGP